MAIQTIQLLFHPKFSRMWKFCILLRVAVCTTEILMIGIIKLFTLYNSIGTHQCPDLFSQSFIGIFIFPLAMAFQATLIIS
jgi:hypothetical protein